MTRANDREGFDDGVRTTLLEGDVDKLEAKFEAIQKTGRRVAISLTGTAIAFSTSAVMLALNLALGT